MNINLFKDTVMPNLGKTAKMSGFYFTDILHENDIDLSKEQWLVLKMLHDVDGQIQNDLAFITDRTKTSLTRLINTIEKKGYVIRVASKKDKRINHIFLTNKGKTIFKKSLPVLQNLISELQEGISPEELKQTIKVLKQIQNNILKKSHLIKSQIK